MYTDKTLTCRDCGAEFIFSAGEQEFFASRGFTNEPGRCPACRSARRARNDAAGGMSYGGERPPRQMFSAVCSNCGKEALVPFEPRTDRPVYCSECFELVRGTSPTRSTQNRW